ncbi:MAG: hypothetical protein LUE14_05905 [Clostridiales bacterium]|nr:hypothetical protein [Clostridiales bacterium]
MKTERFRDYQNFKKIMLSFENKEINYARGKIKELRGYLREGESAAENYLKASLIEELVRDCYLGIYEDADISLIGTGKAQNTALFVKTSDGKSRSVLFDAIEAMDTFISLDI